LAAASLRQSFHEKKLEYQPGGLFSSAGKLWRNGKIAVHADQPDRVEDALEVSQASAYFRKAVIVGGVVDVRATDYLHNLLMFDIQAEKLDLL
jgi:hypothetical protein